MKMAVAGMSFPGSFPRHWTPDSVWRRCVKHSGSRSRRFSTRTRGRSSRAWISRIFPTISSFITTSDRTRRWVTGHRTKSILGRRHDWRRRLRLWFDMDRDEIVVPRANGEAVFSGFKLKWLSAFKMDKMVKRGRLSIHLQNASQLSKEWGEGQLNECLRTRFC